MRRGNILDPSSSEAPLQLSSVFPKESWGGVLHEAKSPLGRDCVGCDLECAEGSACLLPDGVAQLDLAPAGSRQILEF